MHMHSRGVLRAFEHLADFAARESLLRLQQNRRALLRRKLFQRRTQPADRLLKHRLVLGPRLARRRIESALVFVGVAAGAGSRKRRKPPPPSVSSLMVDTQVDQDPVEPGR